MIFFLYEVYKRGLFLRERIKVGDGVLGGLE
jgi:hypothetical protein